MKSLQMDGVSVRFGAVQALENVSLSSDAGQALLLAGPNGAGKSTLIRVLLGLVKPSSGSLLVDGKAQPVDNAFKMRLGYLPEAVAFAENLTGYQVMRFFGTVRGVARERVKEVLARVGLEKASGRAVRGYSRGMRQRLGLGVAIVGSPELLILDEPTGGLDQEGLSVLWDVLEEWRSRERCVVVASHDLSLMERRVDHLCLLRSGKVLACDTPTRLRERASMPVTVHLQASAQGNSEDFARCLERGGVGQIVHNDGRLVKVQVGPEELLRFLDLKRDCPELFGSVRVEEPGLDLVYEQLLAEAAQ